MIECASNTAVRTGVSTDVWNMAGTGHAALLSSTLCHTHVAMSSFHRSGSTVSLSLPPPIISTSVCT